MKITTRKGLWVSYSFTEKFGTEDITPATTVSSYKTLERTMTDSEIKTEFGAQESTLEDVAAFLENPPKGCDDGYANIFYVAGCVVRVFWYSDDRKWRVRTWRLGGGGWNAGARAFGCNQLSKPLVSSDSLSLSTFELPSELTINGILYKRV